MSPSRLSLTDPSSSSAHHWVPRYGGDPLVLQSTSFADALSARAFGDFHRRLMRFAPPPPPPLHLAVVIVFSATVPRLWLLELACLHACLTTSSVHAVKEGPGL